MSLRELPPRCIRCKCIAEGDYLRLSMALSGMGYDEKAKIIICAPCALLLELCAEANGLSGMSAEEAFLRAFSRVERGLGYG